MPVKRITVRVLVDDTLNVVHVDARPEDPTTPLPDVRLSGSGWYMPAGSTLIVEVAREPSRPPLSLVDTITPATALS